MITSMAIAVTNPDKNPATHIIAREILITAIILLAPFAIYMFRIPNNNDIAGGIYLITFLYFAKEYEAVANITMAMIRVNQ
jgi:hypothetical protein